MVDVKKSKELREKGWTYEAIGLKYGVSRQRVHQLLTGYVSPDKEVYNKDWRLKNKEKVRQYTYNYETKNRKKVRARKQALYKYKNRQVCVVDDCTNIGERHHNDYDKGVIIVWLCKAHHKLFHVN